MPRDGGLSGPMSGEKTTEELAREFEDVVVRRLEEVEESNRRLRTINGVMLGGLVLLAAAFAWFYTQVAGGAPAWASERVSAQEFVLTAADGSRRGVWRAGNDGTTRFVLSDGSGAARLRLSVLEDAGAPGISLLDGDGSPRIVLGHLPDQTSTLVFADSDGTTRTVIGISANRTANVVFADREGVTRAGLGVDAWGEPGLSLADGPGGMNSAEDLFPESPADTPAESEEDTAPAGATSRR